MAWRGLCIWNEFGQGEHVLPPLEALGVDEEDGLAHVQVTLIQGIHPHVQQHPAPAIRNIKFKSYSTLFIDSVYAPK